MDFIGDIDKLRRQNVLVGTVGTSETGLEIPYIFVGNHSGPQAIITGAIHTRENLTAKLLVMQAYYTAFKAKSINGGVYFVPFVNPDGAILLELKDSNIDLVVSKYSHLLSDKIGENLNKILNLTCPKKLHNFDNFFELGLSDLFSLKHFPFNQNDPKAHSIPKKTYEKNQLKSDWQKAKAIFLKQKIEGAIAVNGGSLDFSLYKANINGVDLNNNFDAKFGQGAGQVFAAATQGFCGRFPFCQKESAALKNFSLAVRPDITVSYHAKGQEVYYQFFQDQIDFARDKKIAKSIANHLGYRLVDGDLGSSGGYKDWCIDFLKVPALTIEIVDDLYPHPLSVDLLEKEWDKNKDIPSMILEGL